MSFPKSSWTHAESVGWGVAPVKPSLHSSGSGVSLNAQQLLKKSKHTTLPQELIVPVPEDRLQDGRMTVKKIAVKLDINGIVFCHRLLWRYVKLHRWRIWDFFVNCWINSVFLQLSQWKVKHGKIYPPFKGLIDQIYLCSFGLLLTEYFQRMDSLRFSFSDAIFSLTSVGKTFSWYLVQN